MEATINTDVENVLNDTGSVGEGSVKDGIRMITRSVLDHDPQLSSRGRQT